MEFDNVATGGEGKENFNPLMADKTKLDPEIQQDSEDYLLSLRGINKADILRQVEFYFGDENLPGDRFLLKKTGGAANKPIPISVIHGFKRMREYQPYAAVVSALKTSELLVVEGDRGHETIKRKVPINLDTAARNTVDDEEHDGSITDGLGPISKKKKKSRGTTAGKKSRGTGFEEWFCDPPITPTEFKEEEDIYHHSRSFVERIEQCIQRYRSRRKMDSTKVNIFDKYLALGGIQSGVKAFGSGALDKETLEGHNAKEIADIQATDLIGMGQSQNNKFFHPSSSEHWTVDFEGVVKGFLSNRAPILFGTETEEVIKEYCSVIQNFLNYTLTHSVCPEYTSQILSARRVCDIATKELWAIKNLSSILPGDFNRAASTLYGGFYESLYVADVQWSTDISEVGMSPADAERIFKTAIGLVASDTQYDALRACLGQIPKTVKREFRTFEVVGIIMPDADTVHRFADTKDLHGEAGNIQPLGVLQVIPWVNPAAPDEDLTDEEELEESLVAAAANLVLETQNLDPSTESCHGSNVIIEEPVITELFLEADILSQIFVGLKFGCDLHTLDIGVQYFDNISGLFTSFYTFLPSELMIKWKEPKPNPRGPPRVGDAERSVDIDDDGIDDGFE